MKKHLVSILTVLVSLSAIAGNPDRAGAAGAGHLLINPWARTSGMANSSMCSVNGVEATFLNVAGLAFTKKTEIMFTNSNYLAGSGIRMNAFGFGQKVGETGAFGFTVTNMNFGENTITQEALPEGGIGTFRPNYTNLAMSYAKGFSRSIYGGITLRMISESIYNVRSQGMSFDAAIRYVTGEKDHIRFGISLRNVGPPMRYRGDGLSLPGVVQSNNAALTLEQRSEKYELPSLVNVGLSYDFIFSEKAKLTANGQYTSNSFTRDQAAASAEFAYRQRFFLRAGYFHEVGEETSITSRSVFTGPTAGLSIVVPLGKNGTNLSIDYSYRTTNPFGGVHSIGMLLSL